MRGTTAESVDARRPSPATGAGALAHHVDGLDGIRAVSMAVVLLYHGEIGGFEGGFLGISLFFTLSGFLITSMLLRAHGQSGRIDLRAFWAQRYRRLLPAAYLALAGTVVFGATVASEQQLVDLPNALLAAVAQVANWFFILTKQSYVALFTAPSPVQHFWSLAIEEQFYLLMPIGLLLLLRRTRSMKVVAGVLAAGVVASSGAMIVLFDRGASLDRLYYGTDTRAAELLVGALLATILHARPLPERGRVAQALTVVGIASSVLLMWAYANLTITDQVLYRGGFLVASLSAAGVIVGILGGRGPLSAALSAAPVAAFGRITYGVYVFHWPLFLWLNSERTGLATLPLFGVRVAVTLVVAVVSYHLVEMPIRRQSWVRIAPRIRWAVPPAVALLVLGALTLNTREVSTDLAGLGEQAAAIPAVAPGGVIDVLVIADAGAADLGPALAKAGRGGKVRVRTASPFACKGVDPAEPDMCVNWRAEWPKLVAESDPDVVLFHVTRWDKGEIAARSGASNQTTQTAWAMATLNAGFDLLASSGATIVWSQDALNDMAEGLRRYYEPFYPAILRVTSERTDTRRRETIGHTTGPLLEDLALYRPQAAGDAPRVMVVGDSTARTIGYGLERWSRKSGLAVVWSGATEGCGIADEGQVRDVAGREVDVMSVCVGIASGWAGAVAKFDPDIVVVSSHLFDLQDRRLAGWPDFAGPGDSRFDDYLVAEYTDAYDRLAAGGGRVVWMKNPCVSNDVLPSLPAADVARIRYVNDVILPRLAAARPAVKTFDLFDVLCPGGKYKSSLGGVERLRTDGVHFSAAGSLWFAQTYGQQILDLGPATTGG